tara:strand:- start:244 stop:810 length:567 start_codon:yes stop_codon:yes gene_type:complete
VGSFESLKLLDEALFLHLVNWGSNSVDQLFRLVSLSIGSYIFVGLFLIYSFLKLKLNDAVILASLIVASVAIADIVSVHAFKNVFERLRPCHVAELMVNFELVANKCGGEYGFVSSHASTVWAIFGIINFSRPTKILIIFFLIWAITVSYSRVYLGVHYPGDVICGAMLGLFVSYFLNRWRKTPKFKE